MLESICAGVAVCSGRRSCPLNNCTSLYSKGVDSEGLIAYSPGRRRKKKAMQMRSAKAMLNGSCDAMETVMMRRMTGMGTGFTRLGGGSLLE